MKSDAVSVLRAPPLHPAHELTLGFGFSKKPHQPHGKITKQQCVTLEMQELGLEFETPQALGVDPWSKSSLVLVEGVVAFAPDSVFSPFECSAFNEGI